MNIVTSQAATAPSTSTSDTTGAASRLAPDPDYGTDATSAPGAEPRTFGDVLSSRLAHGTSTDPARGDGRTVADDPAAAATRFDPHATATRERAPTAAVDVALTSTKDASTAVDAKGSAKNDADDAADGAGSADPLGTDLAAQLALVSQWAALARPAVTLTSTAPATADTGAVRGASRDPFDVRGKLDTVRATASKSATIDGAADATVAATAADPGQASAVGAFDAWTMGARLTERASVRTDRATPAVAAATAATSVTPGTVPTSAAASATDQTAAAFDRLMAIAGGSTSGTALDAASAAVLAAQATSARVDGTSAASTDPIASRELRETVGTAAWSHEVGQATVRMATNDLQNVSLRLNPEHLGPLDVQMRIDNGVANLQFTATHADTRHAIEASRTTLDQMLGEQGIKLGDWSVGQQSSDPSANRAFDMSTAQRDGQRQSREDASNDEPVVTTTVVARTTSGLGLVDTFA